MLLKIHLEETNKWQENPDLRFMAFNEEFSDKDTLFAGYGSTPYNALHDLIDNFYEGEVFRADNE